MHGVTCPTWPDGSQIGGEVHIVILGEVAFHRVHHHIRHTSCRLIRRQGKSALGVQDGKLGTTQIVGITHLHIAILVGDHTRLTHLTTSSRDGQHRCHRQHLLRFGLTHIDIPHVTLERYTIGDTLGRIDHTTTANGQDKVDTLLAAQVDTLLGQ